MMSEIPKQQPIPLFVSPTATLHEIASDLRALRTDEKSALFEKEIALFEKWIGAHRERALDVLMSSTPESQEVQYALCWLDTSFETSPILQLCWGSTRFLDLLALKSNPQMSPFDLVAGRRQTPLGPFTSTREDRTGARTMNETNSALVPVLTSEHLLPELASQPSADFPLLDVGTSPIGRPSQAYIDSLTPGESERTAQSALRCILRVIFPTLTITTDMIHRFPWERLRYEHTLIIRKEIAARYDYVTANKFLTMLRQVLKQAWILEKMPLDDYLRAISFKDVRGKKEPRGRLLTAEEFRAMVEVCLHDLRKQGYRDLALLVVLYVTGIRRRELSKLNFEDYDLSRHALLIRGKNNKERTVYLNAEGAAAALDLWLTLRGSEPGPLFTPIEVNGHIGRVGKKVRRKGHVDTRPLARLTPEGIYKIFMGRARAAGIVDEKGKVTVRPHDMRRTMISLYFDSGIDVAIMKRLTGHVKTDTLIGYDRRPDGAAEQAASVITLPDLLRESAGKEGAIRNGSTKLASEDE
jgi:integrase